MDILSGPYCTFLLVAGGFWGATTKNLHLGDYAEGEGRKEGRQQAVGHLFCLSVVRVVSLHLVYLRSGVPNMLIHQGDNCPFVDVGHFPDLGNLVHPCINHAAGGNRCFNWPLWMHAPSERQMAF